MLMDQKNSTIFFSVGDVVEATLRIARADGKSRINTGDSARILRVWRTKPNSPQIVDLEIQGQLPITDIVCFENVPLRIVTRRLP
jgi:hypothetical protein